LPDLRWLNVGDAGVSIAVMKGDASTDDAELEYLMWPRIENVGVAGDERSEAEEFCVLYADEVEDERSISVSCMLSRFLLSSTSFGRSSGFSILVIALLYSS